MSYKKILLTSVLILSCFGAWAVYGTFGQSIASKSLYPDLVGNSFLAMDYIKEGPIFKSDLGIAKTKASSQQPSSSLVAISLKFENGLSYGYLTNYTYVFDAPKYGDMYLVLNNPKTNTQVDQAYTSDSLFEGEQLDAIKDEYLKINFVQALEIIEKAGGYNFRVDHQGRYNVTMLLACQSGGVLNWYVSYCDETSDEEQSWVVNAASGMI